MEAMLRTRRRLARFALCAGAALAAALTLVPEGDAAEPEKVSVTEFFRGNVVKLTKKGEIEIHYDFEDAGQLADFEAALPYRAIRTAVQSIERGQLRIKGTGSFRHKAVFGKRVESSATFTPLKPQNFGFAVTEERESEVFTLYCVQDRYFSLGDGVTTPQNMIIKFIPRDPKINRDGFQDWRYCGSHSRKPEIQRGTPVEVRITREDNKSEMRLLDWKSGGKEWDRDLTSQMVAAFTHDSDVRIDNWVVAGVLSPDYVARHHLDLSEEIAAGDPNADDTPAMPELDPIQAERVRATIAAYPFKTKPSAMARLLRDAGIPAVLREEAAARALDIGQKAIVPFLVDGLYADDESCRQTSFLALDGLIGKSFSFRADAPEDKRRKAIAKLNAYIAKYRRKFE